MTYAVLTGGGTTGHLSPALALAEELVARGHGAPLFVGARRGVEARVVPAAGFEIELLPGRGLQRRVTIGNLRTLWEATVASAWALRLLRRLRPAIVVGFGGYASVPCLFAARLLCIPTVVHDQNAAPGLANRLAVRVGARAATSLAGTPLRGAVLTGNPVSAAIAGLAREPAAPPLLAIVGGSLGAQRLNDAALGLYDRWRARTDVQIHHVAGLRNEADCRERLEHLRRPDDLLDYRLVGYEDDMASLYRRAALGVMRAGASTVAEVAAVGLPTILVPLPGAPGDHQTRNASALEHAGAAVLVADADLDADRLVEAAGELLGDPERLGEMGRAARTLARPDAAARLADLVEATARG